MQNKNNVFTTETQSMYLFPTRWRRNLTILWIMTCLPILIIYIKRVVIWHMEFSSDIFELCGFKSGFYFNYTMEVKCRYLIRVRHCGLSLETKIFYSHWKIWIEWHNSLKNITQICLFCKNTYSTYCYQHDGAKLCKNKL